MSVESLWNSVRKRTIEIVNKEHFPRIMASVPYCENWWHSELAWRFDDEPQADDYRLAGFDVPILPKSVGAKGIQPDLLLDMTSGGRVQEIVWLELKQLNLQRRIGNGDVAAKARLMASLSNVCKSLCTAFERVRDIDLERTAQQRFYCSKDLQQLTLLPVYRERPLDLFQNANHIAAAFMLAAVPATWSSDFTAVLKRSICRLGGASSEFQRTELLREWDGKGGRIAVYLSCLSGSFA